MAQEFNEQERISFKIYGTPQCGRCFNQWRVIQERFFDYKREKIDCNELTDEELAKLNIRQIPVVMVFDNDKLIKRYDEYISPDFIKEFIYEYKKGLK